MSEWNEDNFVERLGPLLQQKSGAKQDRCPDAETLCAVAEAGGEGPQGEALARHLMNCPSCADLYSRLLNFERGAQPEGAASWNETEKRLDRWLGTFLSLAASSSRPAEPANTVRAPISMPKRRPGALRLQWGLAAAAVLLLTLSGIVWEKHRLEAPPVQIAARTPAPELPPAVRPQAGNPPPSGVSAPAQAATEGPASATENGSNAPGHSRPRPAGLAVAPRVMTGEQRPTGAKQQESSPASPLEAGTRTETAQVTPPTAGPPLDNGAPTAAAEASPQAPVNSESPGGGSGKTAPSASATPPSQPATVEAVQAQAPVVSSAAPVTTAQAQTPVATNSAPSTTAQASQPPASNSSGAVTSALGKRFHSSRPGFGLAALAPAAAQARPATPTSVPTSLQIQSSTRLWVRLDDVVRQAGGNFTFIGDLLLDANQGGTAILARGTTVYGSGLVSKGGVSLSISGFLVQGARYSVKNATGAAQPNESGAVEFNQGKVFETWLAETSVYEKVPAEPAQPPHQNQ
jgi:hypothetical protein